MMCSDSPKSRFRRLPALVTLTAIVLTAAPIATADVGARLKNVAAAYPNIFAEYPPAYTCELRSPELVASLDANGRKSWGKGHILMTRNGHELRLEAENLAKPQAAPWFNIALGLWQLRLGTELKILESRLPEFFLATAVGALLRYQAYEEREGGLVRVGLRARHQEDAIREASFLLEKSHAIREVRIENRDGGSVVAKLGNLPAPGGGWLVSDVEATLIHPGGKTEVWSASLGYAPVDGRLLFEHIALKLTDADGHLVRKNPKDVNPISYYFSNCRILHEAPAGAGD